LELDDEDETTKKKKKKDPKKVLNENHNLSLMDFYCYRKKVF
jgi:hypothetical protein